MGGGLGRVEVQAHVGLQSQQRSILAMTFPEMDLFMPNYSMHLS